MTHAEYAQLGIRRGWHRLAHKRSPVAQPRPRAAALPAGRSRSFGSLQNDDAVSGRRGGGPGLAALLAEDATFAMPPYATWWRGREVIAGFAAEPVHRYLPARANGQPANAVYRWDPQRGRYIAEALEVLALEGRRVKETTAFMTPEVFPRFGLPRALSP